MMVALSFGWISPLAGQTTGTETTYDVVVYGGTSGGVTAAVQAAKMGHSIVLINPYTHLGGLTSSGLGRTDSGRREVIGGLSLKFYQRVREYYRSESAWVRETWSDYIAQRYVNPDEDAQWGFEPHVAKQIFHDWLAEYNVPLIAGRLVRKDGSGVEMEGQRILSITLESGETYRGRMFVDATYEGDLLDEAGVSFIVGRESNDKYGETLNGIQTSATINHVFTANGARQAPQPLPVEARVDPYVVPGDPSSGLLAGVNPDAGGADGDGDHRVQSYCYRLCLTDDPENMVLFEQPEGYSEQDYELLFRMFEAGETRTPWLPRPMPNRKNDTNNSFAVSTNLIGGADEYPLASYERRREIEKEHEHWQRGLMWTLARHPRVPEHVRAEVSQWGYAKDEFQDNGHWPYMIYVRVGRRMISDYVMTQHDCELTTVAEDSVGMGSYHMDSHNVQRYVTPEGYVQNEGNIQVRPAGPYSISYRSIIPARGEAENLLVPWAVSASHIAFGSIRMEPVFMVLGQSAATAASLAIESEVALQDVDYERLRARLEADGQVLYLGNEPSDMQELKGLVMMAADARLTGEWKTSRTVEPFAGQSYYHDENAAKGGKSAVFEFEVPKPGRYEVQISYPHHRNRADNVPVTIHHAKGSEIRFVNQVKAPGIKSLFTSLGTYSFSPGDPARVVIENKGTNGYVTLDSVRIVPAENEEQAGLRISTDFPGGSGEVISIDRERQKVSIVPSSGPGWDVWWYIRLDGLRPGEEFTLKVSGDRRGGWGRPGRGFYSIDNRTWHQTEPGEHDGQSTTYRQTFETESAWIAWGPPFLLKEAEELTVRLAAASPYAEAFELTQSAAGYPVPALRIEQPDDRHEPRSKIWIQARQHAWECGSSWVSRGFAEWLVSNDPRAETLRKRATIVIVPIMDVDNVQRGAGGKSQNPQDHNRDWTDDPHWPEVRAAMAHIRDMMRDGTFDLLVDLHNPGRNRRNSYFYVPPAELSSSLVQTNFASFFAAAEEEITGPLSFDPAQNHILPGLPSARGWGQENTTPHVVSTTLEVPWNSQYSTPEGYMQTGRELGLTIERYLQTIVRDM